MSPAAGVGLAQLRRVEGQRRTAVLSCGAAAGALLVAIVLSASLGSLVQHPSRYGFTGDAQVGNFGSAEQAAAGLSAVRGVDHVSSVSALVTQDGAISDAYRALVAFEPVDGYPVEEPEVADGRLPENPHEIAIARPLADHLHKRIGDTLTVSLDTPDGTHDYEFTIVGHVVASVLFPSVDPKNGVVVSPDAIGSRGELVQNAAQNLIIKVDPAFRSETEARLQAIFPNSYATAVLPTDVRNLQRIAGAPTVLAVIIVALAGASLVHALLVVARASRRDVAMLRVLGAAPRQAARSLLWSASVMVVAPTVLGVAVGVIVGRLGWSAIASARALQQAPVIRLGWIALVFVGTLVLANAVAWLPGRRCGRLAPVDLIRVE